MADVSSKKPLFMAIYASVALGIVFSSIFIISSLFSFPNNRLFSLGSVLQNDTDLKNTSNISNPSLNSSINMRKDDIFTRDIWDAPPIGTKIPDLKEFRLKKEIVERRVNNNVIIVTFGNYAFMDFILNWVRHLTDLNVYNLLVGAMDTKLLEALYWKGIPVFDMGSNMNTVDVGWGSPTFHKMGREKVFLINALLPFGFEVLMCDTDMVWLKNPLPYLARFPEADVLTSSDQVIPTVTDDSLEIWQQVSGAYNIGIFHWRPTDPSKKLANEWKDLLLADETIWDQNGFNDLVHKVLGPLVEGENGLVYAFDGNLKLGILPASIFCSGHTFFVQAMHQQFRLEPYAVHTTFQYAGTEGKRHRLREAMFFHDPPEYYDSSGGFLSFKPRIPKSLMLDGPHTVESHFLLVNYQLKQIRTALAVASLLNRTLDLFAKDAGIGVINFLIGSGMTVVLPSIAIFYTKKHIGKTSALVKQVMPPLWCRFDRMWFGHPGIMEGTITRQPFLCPMDHVFEVNVMLRELPEAEFGTKIDFREYSFLQNPRLSKQVKDSFLEVQLCDVQSTKCHVVNATTRRGALMFPKHSTQETFIEVLSSYKDVKVIQFSSMEDAFRGFTDKERDNKFRNRVKRYLGIWCCVQTHDPGHIYYDMFWDEKPGWKPEPPKTREDDHPPW